MVILWRAAVYTHNSFKWLGIIPGQVAKYIKLFQVNIVEPGTFGGNSPGGIV